jgi:RNA recognition motif-containing protein
MSREQDKEATVYVGNLDERVTDQLVWELMLQAGRIVNVHLPKDRVTQTHQGFGFVEFVSEEDADYAAKIMNQIRLWGKPIRVNKASADKQKTLDVGAELFVGNLDAMVDERVLFETFSRFGSLTSAPKVHRLAISLFFRVANIISGGPRRRQSHKGLRFRFLHHLRSIRRRHRKHARPIPHEQGDHRPICLQEGWQGRASRRRRRACSGCRWSRTQH